MNPADLAIIDTAAALLESVALDIRHGHNVDFLAPTWEGEPTAKAEHDKFKATADALNAILDRAGK